MNNLLESIPELAALDQAKTVRDGCLDPQFDERWKKLRDFYQDLMMQTGVVEKSRRRLSVAEVRSAIRVRAEIEIAINDQTQ
jgi:hypothetical protein